MAKHVSLQNTLTSQSASSSCLKMQNSLKSYFPIRTRPVCCDLHSVFDYIWRFQNKVTLMQLCATPKLHGIQSVCNTGNTYPNNRRPCSANSLVCPAGGVVHQYTQLTGTHCGSVNSTSTACCSLSKALSRLSLTIVRSKQ